MYYFDKVGIHNIPNIYLVPEIKDIFDLELTLDIMVGIINLILTRKVYFLYNIIWII